MNGISSGRFGLMGLALVVCTMSSLSPAARPNCTAGSAPQGPALLDLIAPITCPDLVRVDTAAPGG